MANFTPGQMEYIENTIAVAIWRQSEQFGILMTQGKAEQDEMRYLMKLHNQALHDSAARVNALVENANASTLKVQASIDKIADTESKLTKLTSDLNEFASAQGTVFSD